MNPLLSRIAAPPAVTALADYRGGLPLLDLTVGTPWFGPPRAFRDAMAALVLGDEGTLHHHDTYAPHRGTPQLRGAVAAFYEAGYGLRLDPDRQILITHGATGAIWTAVLAATGIGDEVLLPDPCYTLYEPIITVLGRTPVRVPGDPADGLLLDADRVARAISPRTSLLVLNSPVNPTGAMYGPARLKAIAAVLEAAGAALVHDEVLDCFARARPHVPAAAVAGSRVLMANSLSKRLGITGWRVGWLAGDPDLIDAAARIHPLTTIAVNHPAQLAGAAALSAPEHGAFVDAHSRAIAAGGQEFLDALARIPGFPGDLTLPDGGVYAFVDVTAVGVTLAGGGDSPDAAVARHLRDRCGVAVLPGSAFGPAGAGFVRISLGAPPERLAEAARRLAAWR
ncbi:pyridoxal phosphate-dependent aminotransferase [Catellatospora sichuanensis]|uniref:pyridoxal phosphate-dependent aminotransferase n=1 Tax=Catellatospora sichuanensis TaxID=1969805 RepID=UPI001183E96B|nr:pyridoxal phosphate-dependent aminotransferase [Catellatospora sichuanensis]